jgi:hypothetical protein
MATAKLKVYPYLTIDEQGNVTGTLHTDSWRSREAEEQGGSLSEYSQAIYVHLPAIEIDIELPPDQDIRAKALGVLNACRGKLRAEHQKTMTKFQFMENRLLGLAAPDILDAE